jgi:hypothetical protein
MGSHPREGLAKQDERSPGVFGLDVWSARRYASVVGILGGVPVLSEGIA